MSTQVIARQPSNVDLILSTLSTEKGIPFADIANKLEGSGIYAISGSINYAKNKGYVSAIPATPEDVAHLTDSERHNTRQLYKLTPHGEKRLRSIPGGPEWCRRTLRTLRESATQEPAPSITYEHGTPAPKRQHELLQEAEDFLVEQLANGPVPVQKLREAADEAGIAWGLMTSVRDSLISQQRPIKISYDGREYLWTIPALNNRAKAESKKEAPSSEPAKNWTMDDGLELVRMVNEWRRVMKERGVIAHINETDDGFDITMTLKG